jgi:hypothetical protein
MSFTATDISCLVMSLITSAAVVKKTRSSFVKHTMNIYTYLMLILILLALIGKLDSLL